MRETSKATCRTGSAKDNMNDNAADSRRDGGRWERPQAIVSRNGDRRSPPKANGKTWNCDRNPPCSAKKRSDPKRLNMTYTDSDDVAVIRELRLLRTACLSNVERTCNVAGVEHFDEPGEIQSRHALAKFVMHHCNVLPAEETATTVVQGIFLPWLDTFKDDTKVVLQAINRLLQNDKHASAMMAHLTEMIGETGAELAVNNPIRSQLFNALQELLPVSAACLATALRVVHRVDGTSVHRSTGKGRDGAVSVNSNCAIPKVDLRVIKSYLTSELDGTQNEQRISISIDLLLAVLQAIPSSSQSLVNELLWKDESALRPVSLVLPVSTCRCGFQLGDSSNPMFLKILHSTEDQKVASATMNCATKLISSLPLHQWLQTGRMQGSPPADQRRRHISTPSSLSSFQSGVARSIETMVQIATCRFDDHINAASVSFVEAILTKIPYSVGDDGYMCTDCIFGRISLNLVESLAMSTCSTAKALFMDCLGGRVTPNGKLTECSVPVVAWLSGTSGSAFVEGLILRQPLRSSTETEKSNLLLVHAILRGCPRVILARRATWSIFQKFVSTALYDDALVSSHTMERFLQGRFDFLRGAMMVRDISDGEMLDFVIPMLSSFVSTEQGDPVLRFGCDCYALLRHSDWSRSLESTSSHIERILLLCSEGKTASIRSSACKSIGNICTNLCEFDNDEIFLQSGLFNAIAHTLVQAMDVRQPDSVQCMALFAVGNLIQTTLPLSLQLPMSDIAILRSAAESSLSSMTSPNEKVSANAVRTCGWMVCWVFRYHLASSTDSSFSEMTFLDRVVNELNVHVHSALALCTRRMPLLTWKQRSGIKRQGWGACNALSILFEHHFTKAAKSDDKILHIYERATTCLLQCIADLALLHEKVAVSAVTALLKLDRISFGLMTARKIDSGNAIVSCCDFLLSEPTHFHENSSLQRQVSTLLIRFMSCVNALHLQQAVQATSFILHLSELFEWMMRNGCPTEAFQCVSEAVYSSPSVPPLVQQKFASRGAHGTNLATSGLDDEL